MTARPPRLETLETVEAPQLPGRMALRQHAQLAALPTRSLGERAFPHGKDPFYSRQGLQQFLQLFRDVYRYTAHSPRPAPLAEVYSSTAVYSGLQQVYSIQLYSGLPYTAVYIPPQGLVLVTLSTARPGPSGDRRCLPRSLLKVRRQFAQQLIPDSNPRLAADGLGNVPLDHAAI